LIGFYEWYEKESEDNDLNEDDFIWLDWGESQLFDKNITSLNSSQNNKIIK